jgi:hypothetical protein
MKNIFELLEGIGLSVPEEQKTAFNAAFAENYRTIADYNKVAAKRDEYKAKAENPIAPPEDAEKLSTLENQIKDMQEQLATAGRDKAAREALTGKKFVNGITEKAILQSIIDALKADPAADPTEILKNLTHDSEGKELPNIFVSEAEQKRARFTAPKKSGGPVQEKLSDFSLEDRMKIKKEDPERYEALKQIK